MGFYIRKALKVGPLRFNLSKSGIGVSAGIKGLRFGTGPRGNYVHMGRGGLYFRQSLNGPRESVVLQPSNFLPSGLPTASELQEVESGSSLQMIDGSSSALLHELNEKRKRMRILPFSIVTGALACLILLVTAPIWVTAIVAIVSFGLCWFAANQDALRRTTVLFYDLDSDVEQTYQRFHDAFARLGSCGATWHISARGDVYDRKYHAGAAALVKRQRIMLKVGEPPQLKTNLQVPLMPVGKEILAFMPDRVLVYSPDGVGAVSYEALGLDVDPSSFIEEEGVPTDATVVGTTWRYVNKNGGPDRRFNNNRQLPICAYEQVRFWSNTGLNEIIQISRQGVAEVVRDALASMGQLRTKEISS